MPEKVPVMTSQFGRAADRGLYAQAYCVPPDRGLVYTTGIIGRDAQGRIVEPYDVGAQTRRVLDNLKALLLEAGCSLEDVIKITIFMRDIENDLGVVLGVRDEYWPVHGPVATGVEVSRLVSDDVRVEIEAVALLPEGYWSAPSAP